VKSLEKNPPSARPEPILSSALGAPRPQNSRSKNRIIREKNTDSSAAAPRSASHFCGVAKPKSSLVWRQIAKSFEKADPSYGETGPKRKNRAWRAAPQNSPPAQHTSGLPRRTAARRRRRHAGTRVLRNNMMRLAEDPTQLACVVNAMES
jgi:hypothetical protein